MKLIIPALLAVAFIAQLPAVSFAQCVQSDGYPCSGDALQQYNAQQREQSQQQLNQMLQEDTNQQIINQLNQLDPEN